MSLDALSGLSGLSGMVGTGLLIIPFWIDEFGNFIIDELGNKILTP